MVDKMNSDLALEAIASAIDSLTGALPHGPRIAIDGPSGAGKSSLAFRLLEHLDDAFVLQTDTFHLPLETAVHLRPSKSEYGEMIDWRRFRETVLERQQRMEELRVDWIHPISGRLAATHVIDPRRTLICDGTFSTRRELRQYYDVAVLLEAPSNVTQPRLMARDGEMGPDWARYIREVWKPNEEAHMAWARTQEYDFVIHDR